MSSLLNGRSYRSRAWFLKQLGFESYGAYLASDLWRGIRVRVFALKGNRCVLCGAQAVALHHTRYHAADLLGRKTKHIHPVCHRCHESIEFEDGMKCSVARAKQTFKRRKKQHQLVSHLVYLLCNFDAEV